MYEAEPAAELHCLAASHTQLLEAVGEQDVSKGGETATSCSIPNSNKSQDLCSGLSSFSLIHHKSLGL